MLQLLQSCYYSSADASTAVHRTAHQTAHHTTRCTPLLKHTSTARQHSWARAVELHTCTAWTHTAAAL